MKVICHFTIDGTDDQFVVEGETRADIRTECYKEFARRGLRFTAVNPWTEEVKEDK